MSETEAVALAQTGDSLAFGHLYEHHRQRVLRNCLKILRNTEEAEDLAQDVWLLVFKKIKSFQGRSSFSTWLHQVTVNCVIHYKRSQKNKPMSNLRDVESTEQYDKCTLPTQHVRLEFFEATDNLTDVEKFMVESELAGRSVNGKHRQTIHLFNASKKIREHLA